MTARWQRQSMAITPYILQIATNRVVNGIVSRVTSSFGKFGKICTSGKITRLNEWHVYSTLGHTDVTLLTMVMHVDAMLKQTLMSGWLTHITDQMWLCHLSHSELHLYNDWLEIEHGSVFCMHMVKKPCFISGVTFLSIQFHQPFVANSVEHTSLFVVCLHHQVF